MVSGLLPLPLLVTSVVISLVTGQDRMPTMEHTMDLMSYTCGETTQEKQFNFVSPGLVSRVLHSHWSRSNEAWLSLVQSFRVLVLSLWHNDS